MITSFRFPLAFRSAILSAACLFVVSACATTPQSPKAAGPQPVPRFVGDTANSEYKALWDRSVKVVLKYFKINKADQTKGLIVTEPRIDRDATGTETKRAFVKIVQTPVGYDVNVEIPYLTHEHFENVYGESLKDGKKVLVVTRKRIPLASKTDVFLEALIRKEILQPKK